MSRPSVSGNRVLVVGGDPAVADALWRELEGSGCEPRLAPDGEVALRAVDSDPPDAVVLDLRMPALDGWLLLAQLGAREMRPRLVVCCAPTKLEDQQRAFDLGADAFAPGPFDARYVAGTVREVLAREGAPDPGADHALVRTSGRMEVTAATGDDARWPRSPKTSFPAPTASGGSGSRRSSTT